MAVAETPNFNINVIAASPGKKFEGTFANLPDEIPEEPLESSNLKLKINSSEVKSGK